MLINGRPILIILFFNILVSQIIDKDQSQQNRQTDYTQTKSLIQSGTQENAIKQNCLCMHNGQCYYPSSEKLVLDNSKQIYCRCPNYYIGKSCQIKAFEVSTTKEISQKITIQNYQYFYYEPMEQNMYSFSFELCLDNKNSFKSLEDKYINDTLTFFLTTQNQDGGLNIDQQITKPTTITIETDECKTITIDYTVLLITKLKTIQKLVLALKLGQRLTIDSQEPQRQKQIQEINLQQKQKIQEVQSQIKEDQKVSSNQTQNQAEKSNKTVGLQTQPLSIKGHITSIDYHPISYKIESTKKKSVFPKEQEIVNKQNIKSINDFKSKSPSKLQQKEENYSNRVIFITFSVYPFMVEFVVFNILFSLTTLAAFIIVGIMIFVIRSRILGIRITRSLGISSRLINDLRHFDRYIPAEKYIKKERKQGDISPNSSYIQCAICLVKFENMELIRRTHCSHSFHKSCIDTWCHENLTCPMCRKSLTEKNMAQYFNSTALELKNSPESDQ